MTVIGRPEFLFVFPISRTSSESHSAAFTKQSFRKKIVFTSFAVFPSGDIIYLHLRVSLTYITTNQWGIELSSNASRDISNEYLYGEGESELYLQY
jgi:hypothetical protein